MAQSVGRVFENARRFLGWTVALAIVGMVGACSGGDSDLAENRVTLPIERPADPGGTPETKSPSIAVAVVDPATGAARTSISFTSQATVRAEVRDADGQPVPNKMVSFVAVGGGGKEEDRIVFSPAPTALTDSAGVASVTVRPLSSTSAGAFTITARAEVESAGGTVTVQSSTGVAIVGAQADEYGSVAVAVVDQATGQPRNTISFGSVSMAKAVVRDGAGRPLANQVITFEDGGTALVFSPAATALTNAAGEAFVTVMPKSSTTSGAYTITASWVPAVNEKRESSFGVEVVSVQAGYGSVTLTVVDPATGQLQNSVSFTSVSVARAVVRDDQGRPLANRVVSFQSDGALVFSPAATALTNAAGEASVTVKPVLRTTAGAYTIVARTVFEYEFESQGQAATAESLFRVTVAPAPIDLLGPISVSQSPLSAYGTAVISVPITGIPASTQVNVRFNSFCASQSPNKKAYIGSQAPTGFDNTGWVVVSVNGVASTTYTDLGCATTDRITATVEWDGIEPGAEPTQTGSLQVNAPAPANIRFAGTNRRVIALRGTGGVQGPGTGVTFPEVATVRFQVVDQADNPVTTPTDVMLRLSNDSAGILLDQLPGPIVKRTDGNGFVEVQVQSGSVPTPVWVIASIAVGGRTQTTNSVQLAISTGQPVQDRFSLTAPYYNIEAWSYDGELLRFGVRAAETFGNPVPDGTAVSLVTSAGMIQANCQTGVNIERPLPGIADADELAGWCFQDFMSNGTRPWNGRSTVVAYAVGEEAYADGSGSLPANGRYDAGETFFDQGHLFVDTNEDGRRDASEIAIPFLGAGTGVACGANPWTPSVDGTCDGQRGLTHVRDSKVVVWSGSFAFFRTSQAIPRPNTTNIPTEYWLNTSTCSFDIPFWMQDLNGNPMPYDTQITASVSPLRASVSVEGWTAVAVPDRVRSSTAPGGTFHVVRVSARAGEPCVGVGGTVQILVTTPKGNVTRFNATFLAAR